MRRGIHFEALEPRILFDASAPGAPTAEVSVTTGELTANEDQFINDEIEFQLTFDNNGGQEGYVPYIDFLAAPEMEITSVSAFGGSLSNPGGDGIQPIGMVAADGQLVSISTGLPVNHPMYSTSIGSPSSDYFGGAGSGTDPVSFDPSFAGQYVYSVQLPFGSFTPGNPPAEVSVIASLDDANGIIPNTDYTLTARGGFALGCDPLDNPGTVGTPGDAPIFGALASSSVYPVVLDLIKSAGVAEEDGLYIGENVSGPNFPITYRLEVDVATGETVSNLRLTDVLPDDLAYLGNLTITNGSGGAIPFTINSQPAVAGDFINGVTSSSNTIDITFPSVTGGVGRDIIVTYDVFIPYIEQGGDLVIDANSGQEGDLDEYNDASVTGDWTPDSGPSRVVSDNAGPANGGDPDGVLDERETDYIIDEHSLAIQKGAAFAPGGDRAASGWSEGDVAEFTMNFQISDYFAFDNLVVDDVMSDGLEFLPALDPISTWANSGDFSSDVLEIRPVLTFAMHSGSTPSIVVAFDEGNFSAIENGDGTTSIQFNVYQQLIDSGYISPGDPLLGGLIPIGGIDPALMGIFNSGGGTTGSISYRALVRNEYANALGDPDVNQGDTLSNSVTISGRNLDVETLAPTGAIVSDGSSDEIEIVTGTVTKELFSTTRNGVQRLAADISGGLEVVPGDVITWRLVYELPLSEFEGLTLSDYLPLPVFDAGDIDTSQIYGYNPTGYLTGGRISFGPNDTFYGSGGPAVSSDGGISDLPGYAIPGTPTISLDLPNNAFTINFGDYDIPENQEPISRRIEIFVSTVIQDAVYAEGLLFTNQVSTSESNSFSTTVASNEIGQIILGVPDLSITKGVLAVGSPNGGSFIGSLGPVGVTFNAPGSATAFSGTITSDGLDANPIDANNLNLDAGDVVTFGIVVENRGSADYGAFDVEISDTLPDGFTMPASLAALNLRVTDGDGNALAYTIKGGGTTAADFFANGIELTDPSDNVGSLAEYNGADGTNLVLVAYDLVVDLSAEPNETLTNTATVDNFSYRNGGPNYAEPGDTDTAFVTIARPTVVKSVINTSHDDTANLDAQGEVAVGEVVTYTVTIDIPEGTLPNAIIRDTIQPGMAFVGVDSISFGAGLSTSKGVGDFSDVEVYYNAASSIIELGVGGTAGLGNLVNSNTDNTVTEQVTLTYRAVVLNNAVIQAGTVRSNDAEIRWQENGLNQVEDDSATVRVVEPNISVSKTVLGGDVQVEGADTVTYRIIVRNTNTNGNVSEGYDVELSDFLPAGVSYVSATFISGLAPTGAVSFSGGEVTASWDRFGVGDVATIDVVVTVDDGLPTDLVIQNTANVQFTSLPDAPGDPGYTGYNPATDSGSYATPAPAALVNAVERTGDPTDQGGALNDYTRNGSVNITVINPVGIDKLVVDTSENHTGADNTAGGTVQAAIGEVVRYEVRIRVPQASSTNVQLVDTLGSELEWIDSALNNLEIRLEGFAPDGSTLSADPDIESANGSTISLDPARAVYNAGTNTVTFNFGDIVNTETDGADEYIYVSYNAIVRNDTGVGRGDIVTNTVQLREGGANIGSPLSQTITVVEPDVTISKSDNGTTTADAGDVIDYTLTITAGTSTPQLHTTAYDLLIGDVLPDELDLVASSVTFVGLPGTSIGNITEDTGADSFSVTVDKLEPGETFQITFQAVVRDTGVDIIRANETVTNSATLTYSTLPSDGTDNGTGGNNTGNEAGTPGDIDGERITNRSNTDSFSSPNPVLTKVLANPADTTFTIGEPVEYVITLQVPEGQTGDPLASIIDTIDPGFRFVPGTLTVTPGAGITIATAGLLNEANGSFFTHTNPASTALAEELRFDFGSITYNDAAAGDGIGTGTIEIRYQLQVENILANQQGDTLNNTADFLYTDGDSAATVTLQDTNDNDTIITIVEPQVNTLKTATSLPVNLEAGETVGYTVTFTNPGGPSNLQQDVTAYDLIARDVLPSDLVLQTASFQAFVSDGPLIDGVNVSNIESSFFRDSAGWSILPFPGIDLAAGQVITITYDTVIAVTVNEGDLLTNEVDVEWTSLDGVVVGERGGDTDLDTTGGNGPENDYESGDDVTIQADLAPTIVKSVFSTTGTGATNGNNPLVEDLTIGDAVTYEILLTFGRGTTENARFFDQLSIAQGLLDISTVSVVPGSALSIEGGGSFPTTATVTDALGGADGFRDTVELLFGNVVNSATGAETSDEQIRILVTAAVVNVIENQQGDLIENTASLDYLADPDGDGTRTTETISDNAFVEIVEPQVDAVKTTTSIPSPAEAGATISYQVTLTNPGGPGNLGQNVTAYEVAAQDVLPSELGLVPGSFEAFLGAVDITSSFTTGPSGWTLLPTANIDLAPGEVITITYDAQIQNSVRDGQALTNDVDIEWTSKDGLGSTGTNGERGGNGDLDTSTPGGDPNDYEDGDAVTVQAELTPVFDFSKTVLSTSQTSTGVAAGNSATIDDLVVGETVTFELIATMGRGTTDGVRIVDQLSIANGLLDITDVQIQGGAALSLASGTFASLAISETDNLGGDGYNDRVEINFGTITNDPALSTGLASEQIRVLITAVVVNDQANQQGDSIVNTGTLFYQDDPDGDGTRTEQTIFDTATVEIVEPQVNAVKVIDSIPANPQAGDTVDYIVTLSHPGGPGNPEQAVTAFDVTAQDVLPTDLDLTVGSFSALLNGTIDISSQFTVTVDGWATSPTSDIDLDPGDSITISYRAVIAKEVQDGDDLTNEVDVEWTSINGANIGERGGDGDLDTTAGPSNPNDYESNDGRTFRANLTPVFDFTKEIVSTSEASTGNLGGLTGITDVVVGETVTYALTATIGRGTTDGVRIIDQFSTLNGILDITSVTINPGAALSLGSGAPFSSIVPLITDAVDSDGYRDRLVIDFGTVVNDPSLSTGAASEQIEILVTAVVVNVGQNTAGDVIENDADFYYFDDPDGDGTRTEQVLSDDAFVEILEPNLSITKTVNNDQPRLNEVLTYTLTISNNASISTTDAFDLVIDDLMDPRMTLDPLSVNLVVIGTPANPSSIVTNTSTANNLVLGIDRLDEGASIQITYEVRVSSDIADFDAVFPNDVDLHYTSTEGPNADERGGDPLTNDPNDPDTYTDSDNESVEVFQPDLRIDKTDFDAEILPGEDITYEMTITNQGRATALGVTVTDDISHFLEAGFVFISGTNATLTDGIVTFVLPDMPVNDVQVVTMFLTAPEVIPAGLESITNIAVANHDDIDPTPPDNEDPEETPIIARPDLVVTKDDGLLLALTGDEITYVITFTNVGDQIASGVIIEDILPPEMEFISATNGGTLRGNSVFWEIDQLAPGEVRTVEVVAEVIRPGLKINTVTIKDDGRGGPDPTPENNRDIDETNTKWRFRYDLTQDFRTSNGNQALNDHRWGYGDRVLRREPVILATYMASGLAQAGSTITLEVFDETGRRIADTSVVADAGGNWLASFPMADVSKQPARIEMKQTWAAYNPAGERSYNFRTYFGPAFSTGTYYTEPLTVLTVMEKRDASEVIDLYESSKMILAMDWNGQIYEFAARGALQSSSGN